MLKRIVSLFLLLGLIGCSGGKTIIRSDPPTAFIFINGVSKGVTPLEIKLDCDKDKEFEIKIACPGYKSQTKTIPCSRLLGLDQTIFFKLEPGGEEDQEILKTESLIATSGQPGFGIISIKSIPTQAEVYLNERLIGITPILGKKIRCGDYNLKVNKSGFKPWIKEVQITPGSEQEVYSILEEQ
ncbi:MAG: PEGA domain-containing protein [Desulfobacterota bacterium]|nr:PEGA domain-containing protein [Thermodesulfobacteriota bacterium]